MGGVEIEDVQQRRRLSRSVARLMRKDGRTAADDGSGKENQANGARRRRSEALSKGPSWAFAHKGGNEQPAARRRSSVSSSSASSASASGSPPETSKQRRRSSASSSKKNNTGRRKSDATGSLGLMDLF